MRNQELRDKDREVSQIMKTITKTYQPDSEIASLVSKGLEKLSKNEIQALKLMIRTSI